MSLTYKKILKNTTLAEIEVVSTGVSILTTEDFEIDASEYTLWAKSTAIAEITPLINSGDIVVNNGVNDLIAADGIRYLEYPDRALISLNENDVTEVKTQLNFKGNVIVQDTGSGSADVIIGGDPSTVIGNLFKLSYVNHTRTNNKWLGFWGNSFASNDVPGVLEWDCKLVGISFTNKKSNINTDVEIYKNGTAVSDKVYTWEIRNKRYCWKTGVDVDFLQGDTLSLFCKDQGADPQMVAVTLTFKITSNSNGEGGSATF